jgi:assimilatory nitrate reductase catalytic subunit
MKRQTKIQEEAYDANNPVKIQLRAGSGTGTARLFAEGHYFTRDRKARFVAVAPLDPAQGTAEGFPLRLNTGRVRDQWHTMTRTGRAPALAEPWREPFLEVSPADAARYGLQNGGLARASSPLGHIVLRVQVCEGQPDGQVFAPIHWSGANASDGSVNTLIAPLLDRISGQPESKATPVAVAPISVVCSGLVVSRIPVRPHGAIYWSRSLSEHHYLHVVAFAERPAAGWSAWAEEVLGTPARTFMRFEDDGEDVFRAALTEAGSIAALILIGPGPRGIDIEALAGSLAENNPAAHEWARQLLVPAGDGAECARGAP